ncbi:mannosyltransferase [Desulfosarcina ovata subsp. ovata]|uniref:Mannosyltransferase n=2 Tax=Desulfosarcina ovata TaxID=83564 RepID=A0A5K8A735_9BACT|nr:mannosyltransferase [Desulfosarcina ovata subsp. ovata]
MGGVNRYFARIIDGLSEDIFPTLTVECLRDINFPGNPKLHVVPCTRKGKEAVRWIDCDIFHPTYFEMLSYGDILQARAPVVLTVHDTLHELYPELADPDGEQRAWKKRLIPAVDHIICVSENTKKDVMKIFGVPSDRIDVVYHASDLSWAKCEPVLRQNNAPYFLYVGHRYCYKNVPRLLQAISTIRSGFPGVQLIFTGDPFTDKELQMMAALGLSEAVQHVGRVSDPQLAGLYYEAVALVYPSLYEGFGLPVLEAMSCKCPVIASNSSSIPEVAGDAGLLIDPLETDALADAMKRVLANPALRAKMVDRGLQRSRLFSWEKAVEKTISVYQRLAATRYLA